MSKGMHARSTIVKSLLNPHPRRLPATGRFNFDHDHPQAPAPPPARRASTGGAAWGRGQFTAFYSSLPEFCCNSPQQIRSTDHVSLACITKFIVCWDSAFSIKGGQRRALLTAVCVRFTFFVYTRLQTAVVFFSGAVRAPDKQMRR